MSFGLNTPCYGCLKLNEKCTDMKKIAKALLEIHSDPDHVQYGGGGNITVECYKKVEKEQQISSPPELTINHLEKCFFAASQNDKKFVGVLIEMPGFNCPEIIVNPTENYDKKFEYYKSAYDENLNHRQAPGIKIIGFTYGDSLTELEKDLI